MGVAQAPTNRLDRSGNREKTLRRKAPHWVMTLSGSNASSICFPSRFGSVLIATRPIKCCAVLYLITRHDSRWKGGEVEKFRNEIQSRERVWVFLVGRRSGKESLQHASNSNGPLEIVCHWGSEWCSYWCAIVQFLRASMFAPKRNASSSACAFSITHFLDGQITLHRQWCESR